MKAIPSDSEILSTINVLRKQNGADCRTAEILEALHGAIQGEALRLNEHERQILIDSLREQRHGLEGYVRWIDDRPMLPDREAAIENIYAQTREYLSLAIRLMDGRKK